MLVFLNFPTITFEKFTGFNLHGYFVFKYMTGKKKCFGFQAINFAKLDIFGYKQEIGK